MKKHVRMIAALLAAVMLVAVCSFCAMADFSDVDAAQKYRADIDYVAEKGIMQGTTETTFAPDAELTRAMMVTILYRMEGEPPTNRSIPFADLEFGSYYFAAASWTKQVGIVNGVTENEFAPEKSVTREQLAAIMLRYATVKGLNALTMAEHLQHFADNGEISEYAITAMNWAVGAGYIEGRSESSLEPKAPATRAEIAAFLHKYIEASKAQ